MSTPTRVTRGSFVYPIHPISMPHALPSVPQRTWTAEEWARIELGRRSGDMDEKWDLFVEDEVLFAHRSWTGLGIYEATFAPVEGGGRRIVRVMVERDPERYRTTEDELDRVLIELIVTSHLLREPAEELSAEFRALARAAWGNPAGPEVG